MKNKQINLYYIAPYFINEDEIKGAIGHRIFEIIDKLRERDHKILKYFWYSIEDKILKNHNKILLKNKIPLMLYIIIKNIFSNNRTIVWFCYPYMDSIKFLIFLPILKLLNIKIMTDYIDIPLIKNWEQLNTFNYLYYYFYDLFNRHFGYSIFSSYYVHQYYLAFNNFNPKRCFLFPLTTSTFYKKKQKYIKSLLTLGYIGSNTGNKSINSFITSLNSIYLENDIPFQLLLIGSYVNTEYIQQYSWIKLVQPVEYKNLFTIMNEIDIGIIPYSKSWDKILPHKLICYASHSVPILSTNLKEVSNIISRYNCGMIYKNDSDLKNIIEKILDETFDLSAISKNSYNCAKTKFNTSIYIKKLHSFLVNDFI